MNTSIDSSHLLPDAPVPAKRYTVYRWSVIIFLCGALVGASIAIISFNYYLAYRFQHPEQMFLSIVNQMEGELRLSPDQRAKVLSIFEKKHAEIDRVFSQEIKPRLDAEFDSLRDDVAAVLDEQQAIEWTRDFNEIRAKMRPPGPPPAPTSNPK